MGPFNSHSGVGRDRVGGTLHVLLDPHEHHRAVNYKNTAAAVMSAFVFPWPVASFCAFCFLFEKAVISSLLSV